jgi:hypothetical protein
MNLLLPFEPLLFSASCTKGEFFVYTIIWLMMCYISGHSWCEKHFLIPRKTNLQHA